MLLITFVMLAVDAGIAHAGPYVHRVPGPGTLTLLASGVVTLGGLRLLLRRRKK